MPVERLMPSQEARDLIELTRDVADKVLAPKVNEYEKAEKYPEGVFPALGQAGLLSLPYPEEFGGGDQPYEVYLQVLEEIASRWAAVAVAVSVHSLSCFPLFPVGPAEQKALWLPDLPFRPLRQRPTWCWLSGRFQAFAPVLCAAPALPR